MNQHYNAWLFTSKLKFTPYTLPDWYFIGEIEVWQRKYSALKWIDLIDDQDIGQYVKIEIVIEVTLDINKVGEENQYIISDEPVHGDVNKHAQD